MKGHWVAPNQGTYTGLGLWSTASVRGCDPAKRVKISSVSLTSHESSYTTETLYPRLCVRQGSNVATMLGIPTWPLYHSGVCIPFVGRIPEIGKPFEESGGCRLGEGRRLPKGISRSATQRGPFQGLGPAAVRCDGRHLIPGDYQVQANRGMVSAQRLDA
jgi:hypothetical protein